MVTDHLDARLLDVFPQAFVKERLVISSPALPIGCNGADFGCILAGMDDEMRDPGGKLIESGFGLLQAVGRILERKHV